MSYPPRPPYGTPAGQPNQPNPGFGGSWNGSSSFNAPPEAAQQQWGAYQNPMMPPPTPKKSRLALWLGIGVGVVIVGLITTIIILLIRDPAASSFATAEKSCRPSNWQVFEDDPTGGIRVKYDTPMPPLPPTAGKWKMIPTPEGGNYSDGNITITITCGQNNPDRLAEEFGSALGVDPDKIVHNFGGIFFNPDDLSKVLVSFEDYGYFLIDGGDEEAKKDLIENLLKDK